MIHKHILKTMKLKGEQKTMKLFFLLLFIYIYRFIFCLFVKEAISA